MTTRERWESDASRSATSRRIDWTPVTDAWLETWQVWFEQHHEQDYTDQRQRSYFRINYANLKAELIWRRGDIPF